jgi:dihydroorotase
LEETGVQRNESGLLTLPPLGGAGGGLEKAHAGLPLVQHSLLMMLHYVKEGRITIEKVAEKMSHAVATCFQVADRGFIREGYWGDLVLVDLNARTTVSNNNILFKCGWSPLEGVTFPAAITHTFVNGNLVYINPGKNGENIVWNESQKGQRLLFNR